MTRVGGRTVLHNQGVLVDTLNPEDVCGEEEGVRGGEEGIEGGGRGGAVLEEGDQVDQGGGVEVREQEAGGEGGAGGGGKEGAKVGTVEEQEVPG